jgi:membrane peptidoglycan carboxypeptidase
MQQAILAAEDHHFYEHNGINFFSIFRASMANYGRLVTSKRVDQPSPNS